MGAARRWYRLRRRHTDAARASTSENLARGANRAISISIMRVNGVRTTATAATAMRSVRRPTAGRRTGVSRTFGAATPRRAGRCRASFFDRFASSDENATYADEDDEGEGYAEEEAVDVRASFGEGLLDKIKASVSQTVDLDPVEFVEEDVYTAPKPKPKRGISFGGFSFDEATASEDEEVVEEEEESGGRGGFALPTFGKPALRKPAAAAPVKEEKKEASSGGGGFGALLQKNANRLNRTREVLDKDLEAGVAAQTRLRADRAGGKAVSAIAGGEVGSGTWTLTGVADENSKGKRLPTITIKRGESKIIGRSKGPGVDVAVPLGCVSGIHCELETEGNKLFVRDLGSTNGTYVEGFEVKKNRRFRIFNGASVQLGAENFNGEPFATYKASLAGAKELEKDSEYGQLNYFIEFLGGPKVVVNFIFINFAFQLTFLLLINLK